MKRLRTLLARAILGAVLLVALNASMASADPGRGNSGAAPTPTSQAALPEDPGIGYETLALPEDPGIE